MRQPLDQARTGLLLSGGIDSAVLLDQLVKRGRRVVPFYVRIGCTWQSSELAAIDRFLGEVGERRGQSHFAPRTAQNRDSPRLLDLVVLDMPLADLYGPHWSISGDGVPDESTPDEAVYLPGRNPLLLIKPAVWCRLHGIEHLALATLACNPFRDATAEFFARFEAMLQAAMDGQVRIERPFERMTKSQVLEMGRDLPLESTFSCLSPVEGLHCGRCNKCAERRRGFREVGIEDRTHYAPVNDSPAIPRGDQFSKMGGTP
jgi:7-cyano-7-deazaguanine synthase